MKWSGYARSTGWYEGLRGKWEVFTTKTAKFPGRQSSADEQATCLVTGHVDAEMPGWLSLAGSVLSEGVGRIVGCEATG